MARKQREEEGGYNFMDTYGDMMTLLLTFFILLFSMSTVDNEKWEILIKAFSNKDANTSQIIMIPVGDGNDYAPAVGEKGVMSEKGEESSPSVQSIQNMQELVEAIEEYMEENDMESTMSMETVGENAVYLTFDNNLFFDGDSYNLRQSSYDILNYLGGLFKAVEPEIFMIRINGHTAAIPGWEDYEVNDWDLSSLRANRVATYFEENPNIQFPPKKLMTNGWGKNHPVADNNTTEGRAANRRVDIQILGNDYDKSSPDELMEILHRTFDVQLTDDTPIQEDVVVPPEPNLTEQDASASVSESVPEAEAVPVSSAPPEPVPAGVDPDQVEAALKALEESSKS